MSLENLKATGPTTATYKQCATCRWLSGLEPDMRSTVEAIIAAGDASGDFLFGHMQLAREFADDGLTASDTAIASHRHAHVAG